jgi:hypothetical protein
MPILAEMSCGTTRFNDLRRGMPRSVALVRMGDALGLYEGGCERFALDL